MDLIVQLLTKQKLNVRLARNKMLCCLLGLFENVGISEEIELLLFTVFGVLCLAVGFILLIVDNWFFASLLILFGVAWLASGTFECFAGYKNETDHT